MSDPHMATGWLVIMRSARPSDDDGDGIRAEMVDLLGAVTVITGVPEIRDGVRGYALTARVIMPDWLKLPGEETNDPT